MGERIDELAGLREGVAAAANAAIQGGLEPEQVDDRRGGAWRGSRPRCGRAPSARPDAPRNLVNLAGVAKGFGSRSVLRDVTLGVSEGDRIGVVGRNGDGKSTLLRLIADTEAADEGVVTRERGLRSVLLGQGDDLGEAARSARRWSAGWPTTSGPATARSARCSTG